MKSHDFRGVLHAQPFWPFSIATADGETYTVDALEDAWLAPDGTIVAISAPGGVVLVGTEWITRVAFTPYPPGVTGQSERPGELKRAEPFVPFEVHLANGRWSWRSRRVTSLSRGEAHQGAWATPAAVARLTAVRSLRPPALPIHRD